MYPGSIIKKKGKLPGKTVAVFAGMHGNEKVGILTLQKVIHEIKVTSGTVYFVFANPPAIAVNKRTINQNLNRLFSRDIKGNDPEHKRARELMNLLDKCDALLDIHSYNSKDGEQFAISEKRGFAVLKKMNFPIIGTGFSALGHGTDGYMESQKKIGMCIECGTTNKYKKFLKLAEDSVYQFLQHFKCIENKIKYSPVEQRIVRVKRMLYKQTTKFRFVKEFKDFERLSGGRVFATDGALKLKASQGECMLFPRPGVKVGEEVCVIGEFLG
ncbi:MAG: succinylglutamate desuccinylase/aspartoacylase family protein [Patescibacteria group bacterium]